MALHFMNFPKPGTAAIQRHYNEEDPEKEKRVKEIEMLLMSTEYELRGQPSLPMSLSFSSWATQSCVPDSSEGLSLHRHHTAAPALPQDQSCLPEESASATRAHSSPGTAHHGSFSNTMPELESVLDSFLTMSPEHSDSDSVSMVSPVDTKPIIDHSIRPQKDSDMFRTPNIRRSILESSPLTPTPFRSTLALLTTPLDPQIVESIKQEPMECAIDQPPLKKIKQEVESPCERSPCMQWEGQDLHTQLFSPNRPPQEVPDMLTSALLSEEGHKSYHLSQRQTESPLQQQLSSWEQVANLKTESSEHKYLNTYPTPTLVM